MKNKQHWNLDWYFCEGFSESRVKEASYEGMEPTQIPHQVKTLSYNYFSHDDTQMISTYAKRFVLSAEAAAKRTLLEFDGVMTYYDLYINGKLVGFHKGGYSRSRFDITEYVHEGQNDLFMMVDSNERNDIPPFGCVIDYITFGGIYRDVNFYTLEQSYMTDVLFRYDMTGEDTALCYPEFYVENAGEAYEGEIDYIVAGRDGSELAHFCQKVSVASGTSHIMLKKEAVDNIVRWDPENPHMYRIAAQLRKDGVLVDTITDDIGFRTMECRVDGLYVNGRRIIIVGMDRHQSFPYIGYSIGRRAQRRDADLLKKWGMNTVRTSHYMQSQYFLDRCDEIGLMIFDEIPGWQYIGDAGYKEVVINDVRSMIVADFNHPGIFIWGVRINESDDDDELYTRTNALAHELDPSRSTGGVRYLVGSHLLEDVYTMNDFIHSNAPSDSGGGGGLKNMLRNQQEVTRLPYKVPYMVTEYMGHTYPTKPFDNEALRDEHARRHAEVLARNLIKNDSLGAIGWCAFDYNTHGDYGAGDKICYHGIFDMFRLPKYAAYIYRTQKDPSEEILLQPASTFSRGDKADYGIMPFMVMTNCDYIEVFMYGKSLGYFFPSNQFFGLPHPPIEVNVNVNSLWNAVWQDGKIVGYIDGKPVAEYNFLRDPHLNGFTAAADDVILSTSEVDTTRVEVHFVDQLGHDCVYYNGVIAVETEGDIEVIGPKFLAPVGGRIAFWVKTKPTAQDGTAKIWVKAPALEYADQCIELTLKNGFVE